MCSFLFLSFKNHKISTAFQNHITKRFMFAARGFPVSQTQHQSPMFVVGLCKQTPGYDL